MASFTIAFSPVVARNVFAATASKGESSASKEKSIVDWIIGGLLKQDQLLETDPLLDKMEDKNGGIRKNSVAPPKKKTGGFGGLFAKK